MSRSTTVGVAKFMASGMVRRLRIWAARFLRRPPVTTPVDLVDPMRGALRDTELLLAFAAQSYRKTKLEKVTALSVAAENVTTARAKGVMVSPQEAAAFWVAYDELAVDMAPLSAHSIRASMQVNSRRFPTALLTPTSFNASLAVLVFLFSLALQGYWVAGRNLLERAERIEQQNADLQQRYALGNNLLTLAQNRKRELEMRCREESMCWGLEARRKDGQVLTIDTLQTATLNAEMRLATSDFEQRWTASMELKGEIDKVIAEARPVEAMLVQWIEGTRKVCRSSQYLNFLCPVDSTVFHEDVKTKRAKLRDEIGKLGQERFQLWQKRRAAQESPSSVGTESLQQISEKLEKLEIEATGTRWAEQSYGQREDYAFRAIVLEARLSIAYLGTYWIAMVMGVLGALTFILRTLSHQLREHTYVPVSASLSIVRICLGAIAGVFGSLLAPGDPTLKSLPPLFIPFVFGYGIEILFSLLDKVVKAFAQQEQQMHQKS